MTPPHVVEFDVVLERLNKKIGLGLWEKWNLTYEGVHSFLGLITLILRPKREIMASRRRLGSAANPVAHIESSCGGSCNDGGGSKEGFGIFKGLRLA